MPGDDEAREIDLGDHVAAGDHRAAGNAQRSGEELPGQHGGIGEDRVRHAIGGHLGKIAKEDGENHHGHERFEDRPQDAEHRLLVTHFQIAPGEEIDQLAVDPQVVKVADPPSLWRV